MLPYIHVQTWNRPRGAPRSPERRGAEQGAKGTALAGGEIGRAGHLGERGALLLRPVLLALGVFSFRLTAWSIFGNSYLPDADGAYAVSRLAQLASTLALVAASLAGAFSAKTLQRGVAAATLAMVGGAALAVAHEPGEAAFLAGRVIHGCASSALILGWGACTCSVEPRVSAVSVAVAFALYGAATFALQDAPPALVASIAVAAPVLSGATLLGYLGPKSALPRARVRFADLRRVNWGAAGLLVACGAVCSITDLFVSPESSGTGGYTTNAFRVVAYLFLAAFVCVWVYGLKRDDPDQLWPLFASVIFFGLLGFSSFSFIDAAASVSFMRATQDCLMLFAWIFVSGIAYRLRLPRLVAFGVGTILYMRTDLASNIARIAMPDARFGPGMGVAVGLSFCMAALLIVYTIMLLARRPSAAGMHPQRGGGGAQAVGGRADGPRAGGAPQTAVEGPRADAPEADPRAQAWLEPYGLSAREEQLVGLLLHGYTFPQISERLNISLNTSRWYAKNIYRKLGIHSKTELVELAESAGRTLR